MFLSPDQAMLNVDDSQVMQVFIVNCLKKIANSQSTVAQRRKTKTHNLKPQVVHHKIELEPSQASRWTWFEKNKIWVEEKWAGIITHEMS